MIYVGESNLIPTLHVLDPEWPFKNHGSPNYWPNFTVLAMSFSSGFVRLAVSIFLPMLSRSIGFFGESVEETFSFIFLYKLK